MNGHGCISIKVYLQKHIYPSLSALPKLTFKPTRLPLVEQRYGYSSWERRRQHVSSVYECFLPLSSPESQSWGKTKLRPECRARVQCSQWCITLQELSEQTPQTWKPLGKLWIKPWVARSCQNPRDAINHYCQLLSMNNKKKSIHLTRNEFENRALNNSNVWAK